MNKIPALLTFQIFILLFAAGFDGECQSNDAGLWLSVNVQKKFTQTLAFNFTQEVRLMENISEASTIFSDFGLEYRLNKHFKIAANYRMINDRRLDDSYQFHNRYYFDLSYRQKLKPLVLTLRERFESEYAAYTTGEKIDPKLYSRTKATLKLDLNSKFTPYLYSELFHPLNDYSAGFIDKIRNCAGIEYQFTPRHTFDLNYMIQSKFKSPRQNDFVIGFGYYLSL